MKIRLNRWIFTLLLVCIALSSYGQQCLGKAVVACPDTVRAGETFKYTVTLPVDSQFKEILTPPFDRANLEVLGGPYLSTSTSVTFISGNIRTIYRRTYTYRVVQGLGKDFTIPAYTIKSGATGDYYSVPQQTIVCAKKSVSQTSQTTSGQSKRILSDSIRLCTTLSRTNVTSGDSVLVTTRLYTNQSVMSIRWIRIQYPDFGVVQPLKQDSVITTFVPDTIHGMPCRSYLINSYWFYPCATGTITIPTNTYSVQVQLHDETENFAEAFFNGGITTEDIQLQTTPSNLYVEVEPATCRSTNCNPMPERSGVVWALDHSGSMNFTIDLGPSRLAIGKEIIKHTAATDATVIPFAASQQPILAGPSLMQRLDTLGLPPTDGSALYDVCMAAALDTVGYYRDIVVLTDGMENSSHISLKTLTDVLRHEGVRVNIVLINSLRDSVRYQLESPDSVCSIAQPAYHLFVSDLKFLARQTGGKYLELIQADKLAKVVDRLIQLPQRSYKHRPRQLSPQWGMECLKHCFLKYVPKLSRVPTPVGAT